MPIELATGLPPASDALDRLAAAAGGPLPPGYLDFVARHDGAEPAANIIHFEDDFGAQASGVRRFVSVAEAPELMRAIEGWPKGFIPLAEDDCGNHFAMSAATGAVHFRDHEVDGPPTHLAPDIWSFLGLLLPFDENRVQVAPEDVISVWVHPDFEKLTGMKPRKA
ncbi:MAG: SMI1/KNR4 family protein [Thermaurantiacus sp.]